MSSLSLRRLQSRSTNNSVFLSEHPPKKSNERFVLFTYNWVGFHRLFHTEELKILYSPNAPIDGSENFHYIVGIFLLYLIRLLFTYLLILFVCTSARHFSAIFHITYRRFTYLFHKTVAPYNIF